MPRKQRTDFTQGSVTAAILKMGLPSMFGFLSQNIYSLVDTFWVSRLPEGEAGVAAVTFMGTILWLAFSFNQLVGPGSVAIISRRYGEKEYDLAEKAIKEMLLLKFIFGGTFGMVGFFFVEDLLVLMGAVDTALDMGVVYGRVMFLGLWVMFCTYSIYTGMRGVANPQMAMFLMIASNVLNLILDPLFMFGYFGLPALGIQGAAIASVTSYSLTLLVGIVLFCGNYTNVKLRLTGGARLSIETMWKMVKLGIPAWLGDMSFASSRLVITPLIAAFGTSVVAAYGVGNQITHFGIMVLVGIGLGLSSLIGQTLGGGKVERAKQTADRAIMLGLVTMLVMGALTFAFAGPIMGMFFEDPETVAHGVTLLRIIALGFPFLGALLMTEEVHMGVGMNTPTMVINIIQSWVLQALPIFVLTQLLGFSEVYIWWSITGSIVVSSLGFAWYYRRGRWLTARV